MKKKTVTIEIEQEAYERINQALAKFWKYEIGGMLIGYQKGRNHFSISEATVADDVKHLSISGFIREPIKSMKLLLKAFKRKSHNYIGEWHSHPQFALYPSPADIKTMKGIISDPGYGVNFALLIITKLKNGRVNMAGFLFHKELSNFVEASISQGITGNTKAGINIKV
ncbi:MAG: Mov34/MPN/PAD-1 family protein [Deltaproteobacteria bacterium]|nr:Mov34/MPN/PAD-1 family protein [Deltaproteobacteria bacterium]